jgi:hypothetical protein
MATVLTMPSKTHQETPGAVRTYRRRTRVIDGRVWEIVERVDGPHGGTPAPFGPRIPAPSSADVRAVA